MGTKKEYHWEFRLFYLWWSQSREPDLRAGPGAGPLHWLQLWPISTGSGFGSATLDTIPIKIRYFLCWIRIGPFQYKSQNLAPFHPNLIKGDQRRSGCEHTEYWKKKKIQPLFCFHTVPTCASRWRPCVGWTWAVCWAAYWPPRYRSTAAAAGTAFSLYSTLGQSKILLFQF